MGSGSCWPNPPSASHLLAPTSSSEGRHWPEPVQELHLPRRTIDPTVPNNMSTCRHHPPAYHVCMNFSSSIGTGQVLFPWTGAGVGPMLGMEAGTGEPWSHACSLHPAAHWAHAVARAAHHAGCASHLGWHSLICAGPHSGLHGAVFCLPSCMCRGTPPARVPRDVS